MLDTSTYTAVNIVGLSTATPKEKASTPYYGAPISELDNSMREIKVAMISTHRLAEKAGNYSISAQDAIILANASATSTLTCTLPLISAVGSALISKEFIVSKVDSGTNPVVVTGSAGASAKLSAMYEDAIYHTRPRVGDLLQHEWTPGWFKEPSPFDDEAYTITGDLYHEAGGTVVFRGNDGTDTAYLRTSFLMRRAGTICMTGSLVKGDYLHAGRVKVITEGTIVYSGSYSGPGNPAVSTTSTFSFSLNLTVAVGQQIDVYAMLLQSETSTLRCHLWVANPTKVSIDKGQTFHLAGFDGRWE